MAESEPDRPPSSLREGDDGSLASESDGHADGGSANRDASPGIEAGEAAEARSYASAASEPEDAAPPSGPAEHPDADPEARLQAATDRLYQSALRQREVQKARSRARDAACTFSPTILPASRRLARGAAGSAEKPEGGASSAAERLYAQAKAREERQREREKSAASALTFRPEISPKARQLDRTRGGGGGGADGGEAESGGGSHASPGDRLFRDARRREVHRQAMAERDATKGCTFRPSIRRSPKSARTQGDRPAGAKGGSAGERLFAQAKARQERLEAAKKAAEGQELQGCSFRPTVNHKGPKAATAGAGSGATNAFDRLHAAAARRQAKVPEAAPLPSFKPEINDASRRMARTRAGGSAAGDGGAGAGAGGSNAFDRLYQPDTLRRRAAPERNQGGLLQELEHCTFKPEIDSSSRVIADASEAIGGGAGLSGVEETKVGGGVGGDGAGRGGRHERLYQQGVASTLKRRQEARNMGEHGGEEAIRECTFRPSVTYKGATTAVGTKGLGMTAHDRLHFHAQARAAARDALERGVTSSGELGLSLLAGEMRVPIAAGDVAAPLEDGSGEGAAEQGAVVL